MCPGDGCPQLAKTRRHLTVGRASAILSVGPAREFCILVGLSAGSAGSAGPAVLPRLATGLQGYRATDTDISSVAYKTP